MDHRMSLWLRRVQQATTQLPSLESMRWLLTGLRWSGRAYAYRCTRQARCDASYSVASLSPVRGRVVSGTFCERGCRQMVVTSPSRSRSCCIGCTSNCRPVARSPRRASGCCRTTRLHHRSSTTGSTTTHGCRVGTRRHMPPSVRWTIGRRQPSQPVKGRGDPAP